MSQLQRLNIFGIRSFGPEENDLQKIKFFSPLTLIQGQNGCGKTTIIEAMKFAITGDLPQGSGRGQGFVFDPTLARVFETRGQVKLRVLDTKGEYVTVTKTVAVTRKQNNKLEFTRLDSTIGRGKPGEVEHISGKCIDIDAEMCASLGVSKAILNNVIFCHQEESSWPLDEGKKLKERFDEIFDATRYKKCSDAAQKYVKTGSTKSKVLQIEVSNLEDIKKYVENKREILCEKETRLEEISKDININKADLRSVNHKIQGLVEIELNFSKLCADVEIRKKDIQNLVDQQKDLLKNITEFTGTDVELSSKIERFEQDIKNLQSDIEMLSKKKRDMEESERKLRQKINENQMKLGSLQSERKQNEIKKECRNKLVCKGIEDFGLPHSTADISDSQIHIIIRELDKKLEDKKSNVKLLETECEHEEKQLQNEIDKIRVEHAKIKQDMFLKNKNITDSKDELRKLQLEIEELNSAGDQLKFSETKINRLDKELSSLESSVDTNALRAKIDTENKKQKELEEQLSLVDSEVQILQQYTSLQTELDLKNENHFTKQNELQKLKNKHEKALNHIFGGNVPNSELKKCVQTYQTTQNDSVRNLTNQINHKQREVVKFESNLNVKREKLKEREKELENYKKELSIYCESKDLEDIIDTQQKEIKKLQNDRAVYYSSRYLYKQYIREFQANKPSCPICKRGVEEKDYISVIIDDLNKKIETFPTEMQKVDAQLVQENKKYENLLSLRPISEKLHKLDIEVPVLKSETDACDKNYKNALEELETLKKDIIQPQNNEKIVNSVIGDVTLIDQLHKEVQNLKQEISSLNLRLPKNESNRGIQEALSEQESLKIDIKNCRRNIESSQNKLTQHLDRLQRLKEQKNDLVTQQLKIKQSLQGKDNLITKSTEIEKKIYDLKNSVQDLEMLSTSSKLDLETSLKKKEEIQKKNRLKMEEARKVLNFVQTIVRDITSYQKEIDNFIQKDISGQINNINDKIDAIKKEIEEFSIKKTKIDSNVDELKCQISDSRINFRELQDNVILRRKRNDQLTLEKELADLEANVGDNDINSIRKEKSRLLEIEHGVQEKIHKSEGQKSELIKHITELKADLAIPRHSKSHQNYKYKFLEYELHERSMLDLKNYIKALDWALMQFHKQRMSQINGIIKELWRNIYKGNDIDYIEIKTDDESTTGTDKRKVYNYRIVQVKNEAELEMRGRCSAGQRVLASLIIRIALSETFSSNCGILTLDEPTTNLDRENIYSLCEALLNIIQQKRQQKNFQLVIITHDQDFVDHLTRSESLNQYYVITRNEFGKSVISVKR